ncbi:uncharacterized protein LOC9663528 [Selaginella moellendorffii]|uniref:uncharacterized protein LOC9663528 n=1 Tax=Selaginella moellendorffii TaxID=88036 RepID=UPI000D1CC0C7|nr:uncharacterized protein LOC9663528 [Selaginella moellendorffii]|eukprot:XP_024523058.1 uncharacterized protein LOC9663528 [Selaginella moellendorffii]
MVVGLMEDDGEEIDYPEITRGGGGGGGSDQSLPTCVVCIESLGRHGGPASLPCGHNGCLRCLQKVQRHSQSPLCPLCRTPFDAEMNLGPNLELKEAIRQAHARKMDRSSSTPPKEGVYPKIHQQHQQPAPEITIRNLFAGLYAIVTGAASKKSSDSSDRRRVVAEAGDGPPEDLWGSVLLPSAPPLFSSSAVDDVRATKTLLEAEPPQWLPDSSATSCMQCDASFRPVTCGRHHCRFCGGIFCRYCSRGRCLLPMKFREREPQRVCDACYERLEPVQRLLVERVSNASQVATHDVTDFSCMRSWLNSPLGLSMEQEIYKATNALRSYAKIGGLKPEKAIPEKVLRGAKGVAVLTIAKAGVVVTYKLGTGLVIARREDGTWSAPSAIACAGLGWGAQMGGELTDFILVLRSPEAVRAFSGRIHFALGAELSAVAGPVGRLAEADVRAGDGGTAACYSYSLSKGAFVGVSVEGSVVTRRSDTNARFYGDSYVTAADILSGAYPAPRAAYPLYEALHDLFY